MKIYFLLALSIVLSFSSCKKKSKEEPEEKVAEIIKHPTINDNVKIIDTAKFSLVSSSAMLSKGVYEYKINGNVPAIGIGDILLGTETTRGYIAKVLSVSKIADRIQFITTPAELREVFKETTIDFIFPADPLLNKTMWNNKLLSKGQGIASKELSSILLEDKFIVGSEMSPFRLKLKNCYISMEPTDWVMNMSFGTFSVKSINFGLDKESKLVGNFEIEAAALLNKVKVKDSVILLKESAVRLFLVPGTPIPVKTTIVSEIIVRYEVDINANVNASLKVRMEKDVIAMFHYTNTDGWSHVYKTKSHIPDVTTTFNKPNVSAEVKVEVGWRTSFLIYDAPGPYIEPSVPTYAKINASVLNIGNSDLEAGISLKFDVGLQSSLLSRLIPRPVFRLSADTLKYLRPYKIEIIDGNHQQGLAGKEVSKPLKIKVLDSFGFAVKGVVVNFKVSNGNGKVVSESFLTDEDGYAFTKFILGTQTIGNQVEVSVQKGDDKHILNSPITFTATALDSSDPVIILCEKGSSGFIEFFVQKHLFAPSGEAIFTGPAPYRSPRYDCGGKKEITVRYYTSTELDGPKSPLDVKIPCECGK